jgi:hypothetical protein
MGETPLIAGYVVSIGSAAGSRIMLRSSYRAATVIGSAIVIVGAAFLITLEPGYGPLWAGAGTALTGLGMGLFQNTFFLAAQAAVGRDQRGTATASTLFARILGQTASAAMPSTRSWIQVSGRRDRAAVSRKAGWRPSRRRCIMSIS